MKRLKPSKKKSHHAFTLIEMIGVLAVIAILAAVLIPKVFAAINNSRINNAAMTCQTAKTALTDHYSKYGGLIIDGTQAPPAPVTFAGGVYNNFDSILLNEQFLDKPFTTKLGLANDGTPTGARVDLLDLAGVDTTTAVTGTSASFDLDGSGGASPVSDITGSAVAVAIIPSVAITDARELSARVDGESLSQAEGATTADLAGRVKYAAPTAPATTTDVYVYLTHR